MSARNAINGGRHLIASLAIALMLAPAVLVGSSTQTACAAPGDAQIAAFTSRMKRDYENRLSDLRRAWNDNCQGDIDIIVLPDEAEAGPEEPEIIEYEPFTPDPPPRQPQQPAPQPQQAAAPQGFAQRQFAVVAARVRLTEARGATNPFRVSDIIRNFLGGRFIGGRSSSASSDTGGGGGAMPGSGAATSGGSACNPPSATGNQVSGPATVVLRNDNSGCVTTLSVISTNVPNATEPFVVRQFTPTEFRVTILSRFLANSPFRLHGTSASLRPSTVNPVHLFGPYGAPVEISFTNSTLNQVITVSFTVSPAAGDDVTISNARFRTN